MTEHYFDNDNIGNIMNMGKDIHDCMVTGNMNAYVYWWITWPNGLGTASGQIYKRAYVLGQFPKYIRPGYNRVDATANPATNVYVSAYTGSGKVVMVAVNTGTASVSQNFVLQNGTATRISSYQTTNSSNMAAGSSYQVTGGSFTATLPAQSITTFVGDLGGTVTPTPTAIPTPTKSTTVTPTPTPTKSSVVTPTPTASQTTGCSVSYSQSDWGSGATVSITIKNNGSSVINGWTLAWKFAGNQTITNMWNGTYTQSGTAITVKNASYNGVIPAKGSVSFGFGLSYSGSNAKPTSFTLNGATCEAE